MFDICWAAGSLSVARQAFKLFDLDGDGVVSLAELRQVLTRAGANRLTDTQARQMVETADSDGNEVLDYSEFEQLWNQIRADTEVSAERLVGLVQGHSTGRKENQARISQIGPGSKRVYNKR